MWSGSIFSLGSFPCSTHRCGTCTNSGSAFFSVRFSFLFLVYSFIFCYQVQEAWYQATQVQYQEIRLEFDKTSWKPCSLHCLVIKLMLIGKYLHCTLDGLLDACRDDHSRLEKQDCLFSEESVVSQLPLTVLYSTLPTFPSIASVSRVLNLYQGWSQLFIEATPTLSGCRLYCTSGGSAGSLGTGESGLLCCPACQPGTKLPHWSSS